MTGLAYPGLHREATYKGSVWTKYHFFKQVSQALKGARLPLISLRVKEVDKLHEQPTLGKLRLALCVFGKEDGSFL
jgi:hypothetical protein